MHAIVPLKALAKSKTRLSPVLEPRERAELTIAMLKDVLSALHKSSVIGSITVVSADRNALRLARILGAKALREGRKRGLNNAISHVIHKCNLRNSAVLLVHADLPLLTAREVNTFLREARDCPIAIAPSRDETGTNAMLLKPGCIMRTAFGKKSYRRHLLILDKKKVRFRVQRMRGFGFDIDEPKDLLDLMHYRLRSNTAQFLCSIRHRYS